MGDFFIFYFWLVACASLKGTQGVVWPCQTDKDCSTIITQAICSPYGNCRCPAGYVFSTNSTKCLSASLYGDSCEEGVQCSHMPSGANCNKGVCECDNGHTYVRGRCRLLNGLGKHCSEDVDCWFGYDRESVVCKNNNCICADGYYERYANICRRKSMGVKDPCVVDSDCDNIENSAKCENFVCVPASDRRPSREIAVQTSLEDIQLKPILESKSEDNEKYEVHKDDNDIELRTLSNESESEEQKHFGDKCDDNGKACKGLSHSVCIENLCYCQPGYYHQENKCMAELGERAENAEACGFDYNPTTKLCTCVKNFFYEPNLRACKKPIAITASCTSHSQCSPFGAAYCTSVAPRRCTCEEYAQLDEARKLCVYKQGLGALCESDKSCIIANSLCSPDKFCVCKEHYVGKEGLCITGIGAECAKNEDCQIDQAVCAANKTKNDIKTCQCRKGYVHFKDDCIKEATDIGEECVDSEQCKPLLAKCVENKCTCEENQHFVHSKCEEKKGIGEPCSRAGECFMPSDPKSVECRNSVCQCQLGYQTDVEKGICIKPKPKKNSSGRPSALKVITFLLIGSAFLVTSAAIKQAYY